MRLSRRGWNNVLIFAVLSIIFIANFSDKLSLSSDTEPRPIIDSQLTIVEIKTPDYQIKRFGRTWKSEPDLGFSEAQLLSLVKSWQHMPLEEQAPFDTPAHPYVIKIYTVDKEQPIVVQLSQFGDDYLLQTNPSYSLLLHAEQLPLLLGR